jgi:hypothetical protein
MTAHEPGFYWASTQDHKANSSAAAQRDFHSAAALLRPLRAYLRCFYLNDLFATSDSRTATHARANTGQVRAYQQTPPQ